MKIVVPMLLLFAPTAAIGQTAGVLDQSSSATASSYPASYWALGGLAETPTMKRQKLARAIALRQEVDGFLAQDGGTLSAEHQRYVQRKARDILGYRR
ncbi:hypothetical protein [Sphingomonas sp.]|uniref:hypothetical protein n=1 Tax=Sphingomonas sp. TaxID=28214 RepID=UPI000DB6F087|nr:hypothetical protein [Sphingomonas sp.]PZU08698.1 MAG: hypothetical protein DI605_12220 [Sphingomonas sp.]